MDVFSEACLLLPSEAAGLERRFEDRTMLIPSTTQLGDSVEIFPVSLRPGLVELAVYADDPELLCVSDLLFNLHHGSVLQEWTYRLNGVWRRPALSRLQRLILLKDRESLASFYRWAMAKPFSRISMSHGQLITSDARETFYQLFHQFGGVRAGRNG